MKNRTKDVRHSRSFGPSAAAFGLVLLCAPPSAEAGPESGGIVRMVIVGDRSGSASRHHIPELTERDIRAFTEIAVAHGGAVQALVIGAPAERPYVSLSPRPVAPRCARIRATCIKLFQAFQKREREWIAEHERALKSFSARVKTLLSGPSARFSDVQDCLRVALHFLNAPSMERGVLKVLVINSDLEQRPRLSVPVLQVPADVMTVWLHPEAVGEKPIPHAWLFTVPAEAHGYLADAVGAWRSRSLTRVNEGLSNHRAD